MSIRYGLTDAERALLQEAIEAPLETRDPVTLGLCLKLCGLKLLQRAGAAATLNGWTGSSSAFFLTRDGWALVKADRLGEPIRRAG